jgi:uncharacterized protein (TIGR02996 family)
MTDGDLLLARVIADPACDAVRLVYADWLEENGQPERAEFVRVQVELANLPPVRIHADGKSAIVGAVSAALAKVVDPHHERRTKLRRRESDLLDAHRREWFPVEGLGAPGFGEDEPLRWWPAGDSRGESHIMDGTPRRGFVESVTCAAADWLAHGDAIRAAHPVTRVVLTTVPVAAVWYDGEDEQWPVGEKLAGKTFAYHRIEHFIAERLAHKPIGYRTLALLMLRWPGVEFVLPPAPGECRRLRDRHRPTGDAGRRGTVRRPASVASPRPRPADFGV